jgi:DNA-binding phage protein
MFYSHAGVSRLNGEFKVRFCNDALRVKVLAKNGHKDIDIVELKVPMTKEDAVAYLLAINFADGNKEVQAALEAAADKRGVSTVAVKPVKAKQAVKADAEPAMSVKEANASLMKQFAEKYPDDAPF